MKVTIEGTPEELKKVFQAIERSEEHNFDGNELSENIYNSLNLYLEEQK